MIKAFVRVSLFCPLSLQKKLNHGSVANLNEGKVFRKFFAISVRQPFRQRFRNLKIQKHDPKNDPRNRDKRINRNVSLFPRPILRTPPGVKGWSLWLRRPLLRVSPPSPKKLPLPPIHHHFMLPFWMHVNMSTDPHLCRSPPHTWSV